MATGLSPITGRSPHFGDWAHGLEHVDSQPGSWRLVNEGERCGGGFASRVVHPCGCGRRVGNTELTAAVNEATA